jgi:hypothetical protein
MSSQVACRLHWRATSQLAAVLLIASELDTEGRERIATQVSLVLHDGIFQALKGPSFWD